jgi:hypothetical protein
MSALAMKLFRSTDEMEHLFGRLALLDSIQRGEKQLTNVDPLFSAKIAGAVRGTVFRLTELQAEART